jgi:hypothetical protein
MVIYYASKGALHAGALSGRNYLRHSPVYRWLIPMHAVSEELQTLAEDKRPQANRLIELRLYEFKNYTHYRT